MQDTTRLEVDSATRLSFLDRLAERLSSKARAANVFADPIERDGVTIVPVAKVRWGFGGGGAMARGRRRGLGGGGGVQVAPLGYIELQDGQSRFRPIHDPAAYVPLVVAGGVAGWVLLRGIRKLIR